MEEKKTLIEYLVLFQGLIQGLLGVVLGFILSNIKSLGKIKITTINCDIKVKNERLDTSKGRYIIEDTDKYNNSNTLTYDMKIGFYNNSERLKSLHNIRIEFVGSKNKTYESIPKQFDNTIIALEPYKFILRDMHAKILDAEYNEFIQIGNIKKVYFIARDAKNKKFKRKIKIDNSTCKFE